MRVAILIPCFNEATTIAKVVGDFRAALPQAEVWVFDNASTDDTAQVARAAGAQVRRVPAKGKGNVVRAMFRDVEADAYLMVDGDDTYPAGAAAALLEEIRQGRADMVVGTRLEDFQHASFRRFHGIGNQLVRRCVAMLFGSPVRDVLSGYRAFSRRFVKSMPVLSHGFEIETEMTVFALSNGFVLAERPIAYGVRPDGSQSKLSTYRDGVRVLRTLLFLFKDMRPLLFFGGVAALMVLAGLGFGSVVIAEFSRTGLVTHPSTAVLAVALTLVGIVSLATGLILDTVNRRANEIQRLITDQLVGQRPPADTAR
ncbi:glycosyltransferase [Pseudoxanthomonas winnipegensis]|uniref:Glycosyltransferase n=1 Tax=Pseudoxanthomonas winnipegensis TaxID=2480810 RepID=A0A4Q8LQT3_9GAMM|nr:glycosyltransferase [Pseudoxanthomonas winnipegensis]RZZ89534.1 glycosyltransferase [Pseudoxanthomonas winnipegensis]TAA33025.1 glycosyltransferase [Pseudoxanthomonas winnipegensis]TAA44416.1 glycosyltransferase [Pseudoxanthomonas winnipegensis]TBV78492.1 glycosyltransferase [Pseudoxanthomonas winnipegensis]